LCQAAEIDADSTAAAVAVLEREGHFSVSSSSRAAPCSGDGGSGVPFFFSSARLTSAPPTKVAAATAAPLVGWGGTRGGGWRPFTSEAGVDFRRFVAAVRSILLFEGAEVTVLWHTDGFENVKQGCNGGGTGRALFSGAEHGALKWPSSGRDADYPTFPSRGSRPASVN